MSKHSPASVSTIGIALGACLLVGCPTSGTDSSVPGTDAGLDASGTDSTVADASVPNGGTLWANSAGGGMEDSAMEVAAFDDGSFVVVGWFGATATFGAGEAAETTLTSAGDDDIFIARFNPDGTLAWAKGAGSPVNDRSWSVAAAGDGSSLITGYIGESYSSNVMATFGAGEANETTLTTGDYRDIFVAKYEPDGSLAWVKQAGGGYDDEGRSVSVMADGSFALVGLFGSEGWPGLATATFGAGEVNETTLSSFSGDIFVAKYNADGTLAWASQAGGPENIEIAHDVSVLADGSMIVTGVYMGGATFGLGEANETTFPSAAPQQPIHMFVAKYDAVGTLAWVKNATTATQAVFGESVATLADGSAFVTGAIALEAATFGAGEPSETVLTPVDHWDTFVARYDPDGTLVWVRSAGGTAWDYAVGLAVLPDGSTFITGKFEGSADFGVGDPNETNLSTAGGEDVFVARYASDGTLTWATRGGGFSPDVGNGIAALADGSSIVVGAFGGIASTTARFGLGEANETVLTSAGGSDLFVVKLAP